MSDVTGTLTSTSTDRPELSAADRCDRCGAQAYVRVVLAGGGELLFCRHHFSEHEDGLRRAAIAVDDERERIANSAASR